MILSRLFDFATLHVCMCVSFYFMFILVVCLFVLYMHVTLEVGSQHQLVLAKADHYCKRNHFSLVSVHAWS